GNIWGQDGYWAWWSAQPADPTADGGGAGLSTGTLVGIGAVLALLLGMGTFVILRRRSTVQARERPQRPPRQKNRSPERNTENLPSRIVAAGSCLWPCTCWVAWAPRWCPCSP